MGWLRGPTDQVEHLPDGKDLKRRAEVGELKDLVHPGHYVHQFELFTGGFGPVAQTSEHTKTGGINRADLRQIEHRHTQLRLRQHGLSQAIGIVSGDTSCAAEYGYVAQILDFQIQHVRFLSGIYE